MKSKFYFLLNRIDIYQQTVMFICLDDAHFMQVFPVFTAKPMSIQVFNKFVPISLPIKFTLCA